MAKNDDYRQGLVRNRLRLWWWLACCAYLVIGWQLFSIQILQSSRYQALADQKQTRNYKIKAKRGTIFAKSGDKLVPLVVNQRRWLVYSDTNFVKNPSHVVEALGRYGIELSEKQQNQLSLPNRGYVILTESTNEYLNDQDKANLQSEDVGGIYFEERSTRDYIEGSLAASVLGFVNDDLQADLYGQYGVEQQYNQELTGQHGSVKALTDVFGVPLTIDSDNIKVEPVDGQDIVLGLDVNIQRYAEDILESEVNRLQAESGQVVVADANSGKILTMANYPSFNPNNLDRSNLGLLKNPTVSNLVEPASLIKILTMLTALDSGAVQVGDSYINNNFVIVQSHRIRNVEGNTDQRGRKTLKEILNLSLNTGSVWLLSQMSGGEIDESGRQILYDYFTEKFRLGKLTGIDLPSETRGTIHPPDIRDGADITYANMTFGQGMSVNLIQLTMAYAAVFNGGTYYQPYVVERIGKTVKQPTVIASNLFKQESINSLRSMTDKLGVRYQTRLHHPQVEVAAKSGTGQVASPDGGYLDDYTNGFMSGYLKSNNKTLIVTVQISNPQTKQAGTRGAGPTWRSMAEYLIYSGRVFD